MYRIEKRVVFEGRFRDIRFYPQREEAGKWRDITEKERVGFHVVRCISADDARGWLKSKYGAAQVEVVEAA
jgi:hypothetical protein